MAKWSGIVGYRIPTETIPGEFHDEVIERRGTGDSITDSVKIQSGDQFNRDYTVNKRISFLMDPFAYQNFHSISFVSYMGSLWEVTSADVQYPRIIVSLGGVYHGERDKSVEG